MWPFTDLSDKRWTFTKKYLILTQDPHNTGQPNKLGHFNPNTWGAYLLGSDLFIKRYTADSSKAVSGFPVFLETFTSADFLELETLGPLTTLEPGQSLEHTERWTLHRNVKVNQWSDAGIGSSSAATRSASRDADGVACAKHSRDSPSYPRCQRRR